MPWNVFVARRRLNVDAWLKTQKIRSFAQLDAWCADNNVLPPDREELKGKFGPVRKPKPAKKPAAPAPARAKKTVKTEPKSTPKRARKTVKTEETEEKAAEATQEVPVAPKKPDSPDV